MNRNIRHYKEYEDITGENFKFDNLSSNMIELFEKYKNRHEINFILYNYDCYIDDEYVPHIVITENTSFEIIYMKSYYLI